MKEELADFLRFCAVERRLAPLTCAAYERDVSACLGYHQGQCFEDLEAVRPTHLRAFLAEDAKRRPAPSSQARATAALSRSSASSSTTNGSSATRRDRCGRRRSGRRCRTCADDGGARAIARRARARRSVGATLPRQARARPAAAGALRLRGGCAGASCSASTGTNYTPARSGLPPLRRLVGRRRAKARDAAHAPPRLRLRAPARRRQPAPVQELLGHKHLDSTQRYTRVTAHELRGAVKRPHWVG
jgi:hypothetical protein